MQNHTGVNLDSILHTYISIQITYRITYLIEYPSMGNNIGVSQWICIRVSNSEKGTTKILEMFSYTYILHTLTRNIVCVCVWVRILLHPSLLLFVCFFLLLLEACISECESIYKFYPIQTNIHLVSHILRRTGYYLVLYTLPE